MLSIDRETASTGSNTRLFDSVFETANASIPSSIYKQKAVYSTALVLAPQCCGGEDLHGGSTPLTSAHEVA